MSRKEEFIEALKAVRRSEVPHDNVAWQRLMQDPFVSISEESGGNCPVQLYVIVDGLSGYFRARGTHWSFEVACAGLRAPASKADTVFRIERYYGEWPSAGRMSMGEAAEFLELAIAEFRSSPVAIEPQDLN